MRIGGFNKQVSKKLSALRTKDETQIEMESELRADEVYQRPHQSEEEEQEEDSSKKKVPDLPFDVTDPNAVDEAARGAASRPITAAEQRGRIHGKYGYVDPDEAKKK